MGDVRYIEAPELASILKGPGRSNVKVIDVRDEDFGEGGHIKGAVNVTSERFSNPAGVQQVIRDHCGGDVDTVVVHCALSQVRGPKCAQRLAEGLQADGQLGPSVLVLKRGFNGFGALYKNDKELVQPGTASGDM